MFALVTGTIVDQPESPRRCCLLLSGFGVRVPDGALGGSVVNDLEPPLTSRFDIHGVLRERLVKIIQSPPLGLKIDVSVDVHGHFDSAVTDDLHHDSGVDPIDSSRLTQVCLRL